MFEHLDDSAAPLPGPLDDVVNRGRRMRAFRRAAIVSVPVVAVVVGVSAVAALQGAPTKKITVVNAPTTTTSDPPATPTSPATTVPPPTTTPSTRTTVAPPPVTTPPVTQPPHDPHDYSMLSVTYGDPPYGDPLGIDAGATRTISYIVSNAGSWGVEWTARTCPVSLWTAGVGTELWAPYSTIWPQPAAAQGHPCATSAGTVERLAPGETRSFSESVVAGMLDANGDVFPASPGWTSFQAPFIPQCVQPCDYNAPNSRGVTVYPPKWPAPSWLYRLDVADTELDASSGRSVNVRVTYTNPLAFAVRMPIYGPCWRVESGAGHVDCSGPIPTVTVAPKSTTRLVGTVHARAGFVARGNPLAAGRYELTIADRMPRMSANAVYLNVS